MTLRDIRGHLLKNEIEEAEYLMNVNTYQQTLMALIFAIVGACLFGALKIQPYRAAEYYCMMIGGPFFAVFNHSQDFRYFSENRRLVHFSRAIMTSLLHLALEYIFYFA